MARRHDLTLNTVVQGAWAVLLGRMLGRDDVVFGVTVAVRPAEIAGIETMVGLLINTVPLRVRVRPEERVGKFLARLQEEQMRLLPHLHLGLTEIQAAAGLGSLFDTLVVFENYPLDRGRLDPPAPGLLRAGFMAHDATHYPVSLMAMPGERLELRLDYRPDLIGAAAAATLLERLSRVLSAIGENAGRLVSGLDILAPAERRLIVEDWNATAHAVARDSFPTLFAARVATAPAAPAIVFGEETLSYGELDARAEGLAHRLIGAGIGPEDIVAVALPRSPAMVAAVIGVLKAGAAYLPLDPDYPPERLAFMLRDAAPKALIATAAGADAMGAAAILRFDPPDGPAPADAAPIMPSRPLDPRHPAYVIYTSGSTGTPKGVVVAHRGVDQFPGRYAGSNTFCSGRTSPRRDHFSFDIAALELWGRSPPEQQWCWPVLRRHKTPAGWRAPPSRLRRAHAGDAVDVAEHSCTRVATRVLPPFRMLVGGEALAGRPCRGKW